MAKKKTTDPVRQKGAQAVEESPKTESLAPYLFHQGTNYHAQDYLGAHKIEGGYVFRVWAPNAAGVWLVSDFTDWEIGLPLEKETEMGVWTCKVESDDLEGAHYKYRVQGRNGVRLKADPYAIANETLSHTASVIHSEKPIKWTDTAWMNRRKQRSQSAHFYDAPLHIYEVHLASWRTRDGRSTGEGDAYLNYREIADLLVPYVKKMGYTHIELLPITEYPYDGSWGYQVCGYFSPTARFGTPEDFAYFVNKLHSNGVGIILDWVPAYFPKDAHGLYEFDGQPLYEYQGRDRMEHGEWETRYFDVGRNEVQSFLVSSALYWIERYHIDGLRVDAIASMLYLDYDRKPGEWVPNIYGGRDNLEAFAFFKKLGGTLSGTHPDVLLIADDPTARTAVTKPVGEGGLGLSFNWNTGWANDLFQYVRIDPIDRQHHHNCLNFSMSRAFNEHYILPVSHDDVVRGKKSLLDKMWGSYEQKFAGDRLFMTYQMTHPGKKLTFMGCEFGQFREWDHENQLEWFMTDYEMHGKLMRFAETLNQFYLKHNQLWENDLDWDGFHWIYPDNYKDNLIAFSRLDRQGKELVVVLNFSAVPHSKYPVPVKGEGYREVLNTDAPEFGGNGVTNTGLLKPKPYAPAYNDPEADHSDQPCLVLDVPPLSAIILEAKKLPGRKKK